ncbi:hypothetical protein BDB01DRAFT_835290 [Pilobolus umbonatus]|nr:hypothetical protein BDB01DRAFT_835290 [Pilobolus umbonatus]
MSSSSMPGLSSASSMSPNVSMPPVVVSPVSNTSISVQGRTQSLKGGNVSVPSTQPSDMELVSQYYERPKKYKRKFTPTKPINQKRSRPKLNFLLLSKLVLSLGVSPVYYLSGDQIPDLQKYKCHFGRVVNTVAC